LCKEWFLDALDFYTFSILFLRPARARHALHTSIITHVRTCSLSPSIHHVSLGDEYAFLTLVENGWVVDEQRSVHYLARSSRLLRRLFVTDVNIAF